MNVALMLKAFGIGSTMEAPKIPITHALEEYGFWMEYTAPKVLQSNEAERPNVQLVVGKSKIDRGQMFISGIGQAVGHILKVHIRAGRSKYFFIVVQREGQVYKYKLRRGNIMSPLSNVVLEIRPQIPGMRRVAAFWVVLALTVADTQRALVAAATSMMATDLKWYQVGLDFLRRHRRWEQQTGEPSSSTATRARQSTTQPLEDPLTTPFAQCFAKVPHHPDFGVAQPITHSTYTPSMIQTTSVVFI